MIDFIRTHLAMINPEWLAFGGVVFVMWAIAAVLEGDITGGETFRSVFKNDNPPDMFDGGDD